MSAGSDLDDGAETIQTTSLDAALAAEAESCFELTILEGPEQGNAFQLEAGHPGAMLIGTSPACGIQLTDRQISRRHVSLDIVGVRIRICDVGSTNGTFVDGVGIVEAWLRGGETIRMGGTALRVERGKRGAAALPSAATRFGRVLGSSAEMRRLFPLCVRLAASQVPVIIEGETGTGKEALAESLHEQGPRASGPFVVFDCTAVPPSLVESELFGHERGAFTGAVAARKGVFEQAHGGTLLIDEIGDLDVALQPKLLRALERSEIRRVGADRPLRVDVRVLAATRRDLDHEVQEGRFRDDLFHRIAVARIELPPLRRRKSDIPMLVQHLSRELGAAPDAISREVVSRWQDLAWPGNVRELRNAVARHLALGELSPEQLAAAPAPDSAGDADPLGQILDRELPFSEARHAVLDLFERRYVERVLSRHGGNVAHAAAASHIARRYLQILKARQNKRGP